MALSDQTDNLLFLLQMRTYYASRSANIKIQGWSDQMAGLLAKEGRPHMLAFLQSQGFLTR